jgi:hypothetical protein
MRVLSGYSAVTELVSGILTVPQFECFSARPVLEASRNISGQQTSKSSMQPTTHIGHNSHLFGFQIHRLEEEETYD